MSDQNINESLSEKEVNDVLNAWNFLEFENSYKSTYYNTYFTPDIVNQQMKNINMNPVEATISGIEQALNNPKDSEFILRAYSEDIELKNMYYKRLIRYFSDMACFNLTFDPINIEKESDYNSKEFKNDLKVLDDFCSKFDFKEEFQTVFRQMLRQGVYYCILRDNGDKYTLQELPSNFCKITGRFPYGLLFDFDMNWFIGNYGIDINMYPKIFKKMYRDVFRSNKNLYDPSNPIDKRNSSFVYWHQCSPEDGFWAWKISPEIANIVPYFSVSSEKSKALLSFFSMKGEHLVGNPREIILLRTAKTGSMSSYIFAPISKGASTSKAEYSFQYFCASELFLSISSMVSSLKAQWNCFGG